MSIFNITNGSTVRSELYAGLITFLTMSYIILTNASILSTTGMPFAALITTTVLVSTVGCILMGLLANLPMAIAPGMGLNVFFAFSLVAAGVVNWQNALGIVFVSGIIFLLLSLFKIREIIAHSIPVDLRYGISGGIGFFIAFIGLQWSGFVVANPATLVQFGGLTPKTVTFIIGLGFTALLVIKKVKGATMYGIIFTTLLAFVLSAFLPSLKDTPLATKPESIIAAPDFSLFGAMRFDQVFTWGALIPIFIFLFIDFFDTLATVFGVAMAGNFIDPNTKAPLRLKQAFIADSLATIFSGFAGSSPGTAYIESTAGVKEGGKTGLTALATGILFLPFMFFSPLLASVPQVAVAPILVLVGTYMMKPLTKVNWDSLEVALPSFLAFILMPLTYNLSVGVSWGLLSYTIIKIFTGKIKDVSIALWIINVIVVIALWQL